MFLVLFIIRYIQDAIYSPNNKVITIAKRDFDNLTVQDFERSKFRRHVKSLFESLLLTGDSFTIFNRLLQEAFLFLRFQSI